MSLKLSTARAILQALKKGIVNKNKGGKLTAELSDKARKYLSGKASTHGTNISGLTRMARATMNREKLDKARGLILKGKIGNKKGKIKGMFFKTKKE